MMETKSSGEPAIVHLLRLQKTAGKTGANVVVHVRRLHEDPGRLRVGPDDIGEGDQLVEGLPGRIGGAAPKPFRQIKLKLIIII